MRKMFKFNYFPEERPEAEEPEYRHGPEGFGPRFGRGPHGRPPMPFDPDSLEGIRAWLRRFTAISDRMEVTQPRHLDALRRAAGFLESALETVRTLPPDLAATDLQSAQSALGEITGDQVDERLLDRIFSEFCVGK